MYFREILVLKFERFFTKKMFWKLCNICATCLLITKLSNIQKKVLFFKNRYLPILFQKIHASYFILSSFVAFWICTYLFLICLYTLQKYICHLGQYVSQVYIYKSKDIFPTKISITRILLWTFNTYLSYHQPTNF